MDVVLKNGSEEISLCPAHQPADISGEGGGKGALRPIRCEVYNNGGIIVDCRGKVEDRKVAGVSGNVGHVEEIVA